jgi:hypothetical protein
MPKFAAGFFEGYAGKRIGHSLFATHPHRHAAVREMTLVDTPYSLIGRGYAESQL